MAKRRHIGVSEALLLTTDEVGDLCGWSRTHVHQAIARGDMPSIRVGRSVRIPRAWLVKWISGQVEVWEGARTP